MPEYQHGHKKKREKQINHLVYLSAKALASADKLYDPTPEEVRMVKFMKTALVLYGATDFGVPHFSADILWRTKFRAPDPFLFVEINGRRHLFVSSLEIGRATREAAVEEIIPLEKYLVKSKGSYTGAIAEFLREHKIRKVLVPHEFPYILGKILARRFKLEIQKPFFPKRAQKTAEEIAEIEKAQHAAEQSLLKARAILKKSVIRGSRIYYRKRIVTSEFLREAIEEELFKREYLAVETIVASGVQAADPHDRGHGAIIPYTPIVFDIFPVSRKEHYYGDLSRTIFKGEPNNKYKKMYEAVRVAQEQALKKLKPGCNAASLYRSTIDYFNSKGFTSTTRGNSPEGFVHGLGHGVGIDIHEYPSIGSAPLALKKGNVITIEPGLYYAAARENIPAGGVRIEDIAVITRKGYKNLTKIPKSLRWAVIS